MPSKQQQQQQQQQQQEQSSTPFSPSSLRPDGSFPSSASSVSSSQFSVSSTYRHHHAPFVTPTPTKPQPTLLQDAHHAPKTRGSLGILVVGLVGKRSVTLVAGLLANRKQLAWRGSVGQERRATYQACLTQRNGQFPNLESLADANLASIGGWDIRNKKLGDALLEAQILDYDLVRQVKDDMDRIKVFRGYTLLNSNNDNGNNAHILNEHDATTISDVVKCLRADIRYFKWRNGIVGHTTVIWSADSDDDDNNAALHELHDARDLLNAIENNTDQLPPSLIYGTAALLEGCSFVMGSLTAASKCPGIFDLARQQLGVYCLGNEFQVSMTRENGYYLQTMGYQVVTPTTEKQQSTELVLHQEENGSSNERQQQQQQRRDTNQSQNNGGMIQTTTLGFLSQPHTIMTYSQSEDALRASPCMIDVAIWCDFFAGIDWPVDRVAKAMDYMFRADGNWFAQLQELKAQASAVAEAKRGGGDASPSHKKKRVRIRPEEKTTEWAIPDDARIVCAGLACVDMQLNQATGGDGGESIETFEGEKSFGGGSVSMACKTLARLCHGIPLDEGFMQVTPPVVHSVVPLCKIGNDDTGNKLIALLEGSGNACRNVDTKFVREARRRDIGGRTALAVLPIYKDGRRGCFFDAASNATFSAQQLAEMVYSLTALSSGGPHLDISQLTEDELDEYQDRVEGAVPAYGAFLFGYPHLLPLLQGEALARVMVEARESMIDGGIIALDLNGVPEVNFGRNGSLRTTADLRNDAVIGPALKHVDLLHMNEDELMLLTGCVIRNTPDSKLDDEFTIASAINLFLLCGVGIVAVTRGKKGSFVSCNNQQRFDESSMLPPSWVDCTAIIKAAELPPTTIINTNGAGDSFTAGLLVAAMLRHTGMTVPVRDEDEEEFADFGSQASPPVAPPSPPPKKRLTPYQLYMRENYVTLRQQCNDDKKAIFTKCHEMWENEDEEVKIMYERKANDEAEQAASPDKAAVSLKVVDDLDALDATTPRNRSMSMDSEQDEKNQYMTNRALNLESAVQFAGLVAAHHVDVSTRDEISIDVTRLLERSLIFPEGLEEI